MGWFSRKSESYYEPLHAAWERCATCPKRSIGGRLFAASNCIVRSEQNYDHYVERYGQSAEYDYRRIKYCYYSGTETYVCCGDATERGTKVGRYNGAASLVEVDHHVLVISYVYDRGFFGEKWSHILCDNDETYSFDRLDDVDSFLYSKYSSLAEGTIRITKEPFYKGAQFFELFDDDDDA